uniref:protein-tyrosine-phosphatase n=1 Tax=Bombyx mori TaxID=7091 RepID=F2Z7K6_BOMMO|nr:Bmptp-Z and Bmap-A fusion protein gamma [Bombyx mori]
MNPKLNSIEAEYLDIMHRNGWPLIYQRVGQECQKLPYTCVEAKRPHNKALNRYRDVNPYDHSRIVLQRSENDYINANLVRVWFQNARAKWRRMVTKQENKMSDKCSPDGSLEMDMYHGPMGSIQSLPPHSPPYSVMGGPPSPNSMECP